MPKSYKKTISIDYKFTNSEEGLDDVFDFLFNKIKKSIKPSNKNDIWLAFPVSKIALEVMNKHTVLGLNAGIIRSIGIERYEENRRLL